MYEQDQYDGAVISSLRGTVAHRGADSVIIDVGGVGFSVAVPPEVVRSAHVGELLSLHTSLIVREDALSLFGFATREELELFVILLGVSGVGPKSALGVLAALSVEQIAVAVADEDDAPFRKVSGIGPKTAKLIVVQLAGKVSPPQRTSAGQAGTAAAGTIEQVVSALTGLGWQERVATAAVTSVAETLDAEERDDTAALLRRTLALLGPAVPQGGGRG